MQASLVEWNMSAPVSVDTRLRDDRRAIDIVAHVERGVPKHEWALDLGDAIHNLRSAFDAVAWGMAHFDGAQPKNPKAVTFPICRDRNSWNRAKEAWIGDLPATLQARLELVQPFNLDDSQVPLLSLIHDLDIRDKHRDILEVRADVRGLDVSSTFEYEHVEEAKTAQLRLVMNPDARLVDQAVLGTFEAGAPIRAVTSMYLRPEISVLVNYGGTSHDVLQLLPALVSGARGLLDGLLSGFDRVNDDGTWEPVEVS